MKRSQLSGKRFGKLKVIALSAVVDENLLWRCQCDCGAITFVRSSDLNSGHTKSCGCLKREVGGIRNKTHGDSSTKFYATWRSMKGRIFRKNSKDYKNYGGRGINVCKRWLTYDNFKSDMYASYESHVKEFGIKNTTIERTNNDGNYEPTNCRWATKAEQRHNMNRR